MPDDPLYHTYNKQKVYLDHHRNLYPSEILFLVVDMGYLVESNLLFGMIHL